MERNKTNPLVSNGMYYASDLYGTKFGNVSSATDATPEPSEQAVYAGENQNAVSAKVEHKNILIWFGIIVAVLVVTQLKW